MDLLQFLPAIEYATQCKAPILLDILPRDERSKRDDRQAATDDSKL